MTKILIVTGGSGGHVIPALTIFDHLKKNYIKEEEELDQIIKFLDNNSELKQLISKYCKEGYSSMYKIKKIKTIKTK